MSDSESDTRASRSSRISTLKGADNYASWELSLGAHLTAKGLVEYITGTATSDAKSERKKAKAWGDIINSLSDTVKANLSADSRSFLKADPLLLFTELKAAYSASNGARQAALLHRMWTSPIPEGEDPLPHLGRIREAHGQIVSGGEVLSDKMLAFAMAMSLPSSFETVVQSLYSRIDFKSADVQAAVQAEWGRRASDTANALAAAKSRPAQLRFGSRLAPRAPGNKFCSHHGANSSHSSDRCFILHPELRPGNNKAKAKVATEQLEIATADLAQLKDDAHGAAFISASPADLDTLIVDSGASHHMVGNSALLSNITERARIAITLGNGRTIYGHQHGMLKVGDLVLHKVLYVPDLACNLVSVSSSPGKWEFSQHSATLSKDGKRIITAHVKNGLYILKTGTLAWRI